MKETGAGSAWRMKLHEVIFEADTPTGKWFDDYRFMRNDEILIDYLRNHRDHRE
jgi:hypothetical protein